MEVMKSKQHKYFSFVNSNADRFTFHVASHVKYVRSMAKTFLHLQLKPWRLKCRYVNLIEEINGVRKSYRQLTLINLRHKSELPIQRLKQLLQNSADYPA